MSPQAETLASHLRTVGLKRSDFKVRTDVWSETHNGHKSRTYGLAYAWPKSAAAGRAAAEKLSDLRALGVKCRGNDERVIFLTY
jgi:hypothetical protein